MPVKSFTAETVRLVDGRTMAAYFLDIERLTEHQTRILLLGIQHHYGFTLEGAMQELGHGLPIPVADCTPMQ